MSVLTDSVRYMSIGVARLANEQMNRYPPWGEGGDGEGKTATEGDKDKRDCRNVGLQKSVGRKNLPLPYDL